MLTPVASYMLKSKDDIFTDGSGSKRFKFEGTRLFELIYPKGAKIVSLPSDRFPTQKTPYAFR